MDRKSSLIASTIRSTTGLAIAMAALLVAGCNERSSQSKATIAPDRTQAAAPGNAPSVVNIFNWEDYVAEDTLQRFQTETGIRVNYNVYSSNQTMLDALKLHPNGYDLIFPSARPYAQEMVRSGELIKLDFAALPNRKHLNPDILRELEQIDPGNAHLVPYMWGTTGLGVNVKKVREALGSGAALDSWNLLFDPATAAKLSPCGIGVLDDNLESLASARIWRGRDVNDYSEEGVDAAKAAFTAIRPHIRKITGSSELIRDLAVGDLCLVLSFSGDVIQAQTKAAEIKDGPEIRYVIPREGALRWTDVVAIPKGAKNTANAHRFLNYLMEPKTIADITNFVAYANANSGSTPLIDKAIAEDASIYPPPAVQAKLQALRQMTAEEATRHKNAWIKVVYGEL